MQPTFRLVSWNVNRRRRDLQAQVAAILQAAPDFVCLQEVTRATIGPLRDGLALGGLADSVDSFSDSPPWVMKGPRRYGVLIATRYRAAALNDDSHPTDSWPERIVTARIATPSGPLLLTTVHVPPGSSNGWTKVAVLEALTAHIAREAGVPRIVCGDFNTPQLELSTGETVTWAQRVTPDGPRVRVRFRGGSGLRWDAAERAILRHPNLSDAFQTLHGYGVAEASWNTRRGQAAVGRRFDHAFCSPAIQPVRCTYAHAPREAGLSDHSALIVDFRPAPSW